MSRELVVYPDSGPEVGLWDGGYRLWRRTDASTDAFLRVGRTVVASVGAALDRLGELPTHVVLVVPGRSPGEDVTVQCVSRDRREALVRVLLPRGFAQLQVEVQRATIARSLVEAAGVACGPEIRDLVSRAAEHAGEQRFVHCKTSPWKWAPGRRRRARLTGWLADDGFARVRAEVDDGERVHVSTPVRGSTTVRRLDRTLGSLRWRGPDRLELDSAGVRIRGFDASMEVGAERVVFDIDDDGRVVRHDHEHGGPDATQAPSAVTTSASTLSVPVTALADDALYVELDCGPVEDDSARRYADAVDAYSDAIRTDPVWLAWLTALQVPSIWLTVQVDPTAEGDEVSAGRDSAGRGLWSRLRILPPRAHESATSSRQAHDDVTSLIEALRSLVGAPSPPALPPVPLVGVDEPAGQE